METAFYGSEGCGSAKLKSVTVFFLLLTKDKKKHFFEGHYVDIIKS